MYVAIAQQIFIRRAIDTNMAAGTIAKLFMSCSEMFNEAGQYSDQGGGGADWADELFKAMIYDYKDLSPSLKDYVVLNSK
jgi:hypothetical protein